jgi:hypothetical protein
MATYLQDFANTSVTVEPCGVLFQNAHQKYFTEGLNLAEAYIKIIENG